jgi:hypothetical protein
MRSIAFVLVLSGLAVCQADTLDFGRQMVVVNVLLSDDVAKADPASYKNRALAVLRGSFYDRDMTVGSFLAANPKQANRLERMTLDFRQGETKYRSDGMVAIEYDFPITSSMLEQLAPRTGGGRLLGRRACPCCGQPWPDDKEVPSGVTLVPYETQDAPVYTGILVDVRGLGIRPAFFPRVVTEQDDEVFGPGFVDPKELVRQGMVAFYATKLEAVAGERVGSEPLVIRAIAVAGADSCDAVVSGYDAARIHGSKANLELLARCRVGFLAD